MTSGGSVKPTLRASVLQDFFALLVLRELVLQLPTVAPGLRVLRKPLLEIARCGVLHHPVLKAIADSLHEEKVHLLGHNVECAPAHDFAVGVKRHLRRARGGIEQDMGAFEDCRAETSSQLSEVRTHMVASMFCAFAN